MKELFNKLSNVSQFFSGDRLVYRGGNSSRGHESYVPAPRVSTGAKPKLDKPIVRAKRAVKGTQKAGNDALARALSPITVARLIRDIGKTPQQKQKFCLKNPKKGKNNIIRYDYSIKREYAKYVGNKLQLRDLFSGEEKKKILYIKKASGKGVYVQPDAKGDYLSVNDKKPVTIANGDQIFAPSNEAGENGMFAIVNKHLKKQDALKPKGKYAIKEDGNKYYTMKLGTPAERRSVRLKTEFHTKFVKVKINSKKFHKDKVGNEFRYAYKDPSRKNDYYFLGQQGQGYSDEMREVWRVRVFQGVQV